MKVITGKVRFSYANVWEPKSINGGDPKYSVSLIIPKADKVTINKVKEAIEAAKKEGISKLGGSIPDNLKMPLRDGDVDRVEEEAYKDSYFINANSSTKPGIVDKNVQTITDKSEFYSGCYGRASITFYAYNVDGNKGIACGLENLQKLEDGESLGGHSRAEDDFNAASDNFLD
ncbi:DUF2815 family protein [Clostridium drakei]|uniref:Phage protein n=1 Tax=Clostridium drakei TaxID=332101 RepID=A0A2U8DM45_9CLOT|nr:DUF2815 family protein [Clostridium drakei]AWI03481.1 hypothetical protein B9W14_02935 [Clostridium drakei]